MTYHAVFSKNEIDPEPLKIIKYWRGYSRKPRQEADVFGYNRHDYVVVRVSKRWLENHKQYSVCRIALEG